MVEYLFAFGAEYEAQQARLHAARYAESARDCFSKEEIQNISGLAATLQKIRLRVLTAGISVEVEREKLLQDYQKNSNI